jgi:hypothetical protein
MNTIRENPRPSVSSAVKMKRFTAKFAKFFSLLFPFVASRGAYGGLKAASFYLVL